MNQFSDMPVTLAGRMYETAARLFPICRSLTGNGVRSSLAILSELIPLTRHEVPTGTRAFDWVVPKEWNIKKAYIEDEHGRKILDFSDHNLHVVQYSTPVDDWVSLETLEEHLYSLPEQPEAIPYVASYYSERWGFCIEHSKRLRLRPGRYHVVIDSELKDGHLTYADCVIPGESSQEVLFTTYICHPSMANNELSGPVVNAFLASWIRTLPRRRYTYRFVFAPETIGALVYLSKHLCSLQKHVVAGFNVTCAGDERCYSYVASPDGTTYADALMDNALRFVPGKVVRYSYLERASDERQYCAPGIGLPLVTFCRSRFRAYPEYHTSLDNLDMISGKGLADSFGLLQNCVLMLERNCVPMCTVHGEPQLGKRGLYPTLSRTGATDNVETLLNVLSYADGRHDLLTISSLLNAPVTDLWPLIETLREHGLLKLLPLRGREAALKRRYPHLPRKAPGTPKRQSSPAARPARLRSARG